MAPQCRFFGTAAGCRREHCQFAHDGSGAAAQQAQAPGGVCPQYFATGACPNRATCEFSHPAGGGGGRGPGRDRGAPGDGSGHGGGRGRGAFASESPRGGQNLYFFLRHEVGRDVPLESPHQMRKFVQAVLREPDVSTQVSDLGSDAGRRRLQQLEAAAERVQAEPMRQAVSFQLTWVPLLRAVTARRFADSPLSARVTPVFATLATPRVCDALARCLAQLLERGGVDVADAAGREEKDQVWAPATWPDVLGPVAAFAHKAATLDRALALQPSFAALVQALPTQLEAWAAREPAVADAQLLRALRASVTAALAPVAAARQAQEAAAERAAAAAERERRHRIYGGGAAAAAAGPPADGPGELSPHGPRHDNDFIDFRRVRIGPTEAEVLAPRAPFLPVNAAGAAPHAGVRGADALLDTHFRLLRHDLLAPLLDSASALQELHAAPAAGGAAALALRGNRLRARGGADGRDAADLYALRNLSVLGLHSVSAGAERGTRAGLYYLVEFDQPGSGPGKKPRSKAELAAHWAASRHLERGALVCAWLPPRAGTGITAPRLVFATVVERSDGSPAPDALLLHSKTRARIGIAPCGPAFCAPLVELASLPDAQGAGECLLLEASGSFFAYEPVLRSLQLMQAIDLPFQRYLLPTQQQPPPDGAEPAAAPAALEMQLPAYVAAATAYDLRLLARPNASAADLEALRAVRLADVDAFPLDALRAATTFDDRQLEAIRAALFSEVSLIQGPPGTGKTYVGVQIMRLLLSNCQNAERNPAGDDAPPDPGRAAVPRAMPDVGPILCVCFTNHALDQFLEALLDARCVRHPADLVRVGGRSKSDRLTPHNLIALAREPGLRSGAQGRLLWQAMQEVRDCDERMEPLLNTAVGDMSKMTWRDLDDFLCMGYPAAWNAFREEIKSNEGFEIKGDVLTLWLRERRTDAAVAAGAAAEARGAAAAAAAVELANPFGRLNMDDEEEAQPPAAAPAPAPAPRPPPPAPRRAEVISDARLQELLACARAGHCAMCGDAAACVCMERPKFELGAFSPAERRALAQAWHAQLHAVQVSELEHAVGDYEVAAERLQQTHDDVKLNVLRRARIIGMTTTGVAQNQRLVAALGPRIVIVEEAAEVMEAHILAALSPRAQHLILIGDHMQLRPKPQVYELSVESKRGYNLDVSMFERLAAAGAASAVPLVTLAMQWRMRPSISALVRHTVYPDLQDAPPVHNYPGVLGVREPLFFVDHEHPEAGEEEDAGALTGSKKNAGEAAFVVALARYLLLQGYKPGQVAVLTPYVGQLKLLRRLLSAVTMVFVSDADEADLQKAAEAAGEEDAGDHAQPADATPVQPGSAPFQILQLKERVRLATIDNFQGEEADVVVISLVRNNAASRVGFVATPNRANVLLSRAKHGMYVVGNARTFRNSRRDGMWAQVLDVLEEQGLVGTALPLRCENHPDVLTPVSSAVDIATLCGDGGCAQACAFRLPCGHTCGRRCHPDDREHRATRCAKPCARGRPCGHPCEAACSAPCPPCPVGLDVVLPCGHAARVRCHETAALHNVRCKVPVCVAADGCGHELTLPCWRRDELPGHPELCTAPCRAPLQGCAHQCPAACGACRGPLVLPARPPQHAACVAACERGLMCGHSCAATCHSAAETPCPPCSAPCAVACEHSKCSKPCAEACAPCAEPCGWECEHRGACVLPCGAPCDRLPCDERCARMLSCGHRCPSLCGEPCPGPECCRECASPERADMVVDLIMSTTLAEHDPDDSPLLALPCGHVFTAETLDGCVALAASYARDAASEWSAALPLNDKLGALPACPMCRAPLRGVRRYSRVLNHAACQQALKKFIVESAQHLAAAEAELGASAGGELAARVAAATRARKAMLALVRSCAEPPTVRVYTACLAALQRAGLPTEQLPVPKPDAGPRCRALLGLAGAHSRLMSIAAEAMCAPAPPPPPPMGGLGGSRGDGRDRGAKQPAATLESFERSAADALSALQEALVVAADGNLGSTARRCQAQLAQHLAQHVADRLRLRDHAPGAERRELFAVPAEHVERLRAQLQRADEAADAACRGAQASEADVVAAAQAVRERLPGLADAIDNTLADVEARMIFAALGLTGQGFTGTGHFFQCPNGHVYVIGECGGAMQTSRCPECGARIGGSQHNLVADNAPAVDFMRRATGGNAD